MRYLIGFFAVLLLLQVLWVPVGIHVHKGRRDEPYWSTVTFSNRTDSSLRVTPIVSPAWQEERRPLAYCEGPERAFLTGRRSRFSVAPGEQVTIAYYENNVWVREMVIETPSGEIFQMQGHPGRLTWELGDLAGLSEVEPPVMAAYEQAKVPSRRPWVSQVRSQFFAATVCISAVLTLGMAFLRRSRRRPTPPRNAPPPSWEELRDLPPGSPPG